MLPCFCRAASSVLMEAWMCKRRILYVVSLCAVLMRTSHSQWKPDTSSRRNSFFVASFRGTGRKWFAGQVMCTFSSSRASVKFFASLENSLKSGVQSN